MSDESDEEYSASSEEEKAPKGDLSHGAPLKLACKPPTLKGKPLVWAEPRQPRYVALDEQDYKNEKKRSEKRHKDKDGNYYSERRFPYGHKHLRVLRKVYDDSNWTPFPAPITGIRKLGERHRTQPYLYYTGGKNPALMLVNPEKKLQESGLVMDVTEDLSRMDEDDDTKPNEVGEVPQPRPVKLLDDPWDQRRLVLAYMEQLKKGERQRFEPHQSKDWKKAVKARIKVETRQEKQEATWKNYMKKFRERAQKQAKKDKKAKEKKEKAAATAAAAGGGVGGILDCSDEE